MFNSILKGTYKMRVDYKMPVKLVIFKPSAINIFKSVSKNVEMMEYLPDVDCKKKGESLEMTII